jgi:glucose-6-phosphate isomerase
MDRHFRLAEPPANAPLIAAFADQLCRQKLGCQSRAVFPYDERLRLLVSYLQQLEMESNGKSVTSDSRPAGRSTAPVTWGGVGTDAQHAVFQLLHQGTDVIPAEFLAVTEQEDSQDPAHQRALLLNAFAQGAALMAGETSDDPYRASPGNRPSVTILLDRLDPRTLGALLAFYEHRTFANAVLLGIKGYVENMADGKVHAVIEGDDHQIDKLLELLRQGPVVSQVRDVKMKQIESAGYQSFEVR